MPSSRPAITENETLALRALLMGRDLYAPFGHACYSFAVIHEKSGLSKSLVRRTVRSLARKGFAEYHRGLWNDHGEPKGAGYCISNKGADLADSLGLEMPDA